jgi:hypothetical protein
LTFASTTTILRVPHSSLLSSPRISRCTVPHVREANVGLSPTTRTNDPADNETDNCAAPESSAGGAAVNSPGRKPGVERGSKKSGRVSGPTTLPKAVAGARSAQATNKEIFRAFATAGEKLADLHVNYEKQPDATCITRPSSRPDTTASSSRPEPRPRGAVEGPAFDFHMRHHPTGCPILAQQGWGC